MVVPQGSNPRYPRETDFDSGVVTTELRPVNGNLRWNHPWVNVKAYSDRKTVARQVSNLRNPRETDFNSVVVTTYQRLVNMNLQWNHPWVKGKACSERKTSVRQVSNLRYPRETDFDSVVVTTLAMTKLRWAFDETIHECMSRCIPREKHLVVCRFRTCIYIVQETDFDSVVVNTLASILPWDAPPRNNEKHLSAGLESAPPREHIYNLFWFQLVMTR